jgi:hypothetical protein
MGEECRGDGQTFLTRAKVQLTLSRTLRTEDHRSQIRAPRAAASWRERLRGDGGSAPRRSLGLEAHPTPMRRQEGPAAPACSPRHSDPL